MAHFNPTEDNPQGDYMNYSEPFGRVLRQLRLKQGMSQEELGYACSLHRTYISLLERGMRNPTLNTIFDLAAVLDSSPSKIVAQVEQEMTDERHSNRKRREHSQ